MNQAVKLYTNTGLQPGDVLDSKEKLTSSVTYTPSNAIIKQERYLATLRVEMNVESADNVDYAKIGETCYWVTGYVMLNDDVCEFQLQMDGITTVGIENINVISGWCTRRCVTNDEAFTNVLPEPFQPMDHYVVELGGTFGTLHDEAEDGCYDIVVSTCNLAAFNGVKGTVSELYESITDSDLPEGSEAALMGVFVPSIPPLSKYTSYVSSFGGIANGVTVPGTAAFLTDKVDVALQRCHALGQDNVIVYSYSLPKNYVSEITYESSYTLPSIFSFAQSWVDNFVGNTQIKSLSADLKFVESNLLLEYIVDGASTAKNKKAYSGQFQKITLMSLVSGNSSSFDVEDIMTSTKLIQYKLCADLRYNGYPFIYPMAYKGDDMNPMLFGLVTGGVWQTSPIGVKGISGYETTRVSQRLKLFENLGLTDQIIDYIEGDK